MVFDNNHNIESFAFDDSNSKELSPITSYRSETGTGSLKNSNGNELIETIAELSPIPSNRSETAYSSLQNDNENEHIESIDISSLEFNLTHFEPLEKDMESKSKENHLQYNVLMKDQSMESIEVTKLKRSLRSATMLECSYFLNKRDIDMCRNYKHDIIKRRPSKAKKLSPGGRDPYVIALIFVLETKYAQFNRYCDIKITSKNRNKNGWLFYGECIHEQCRCYRFKMSSTKSAFENDERAYKVDVVVNKLVELNHSSEPKVGYAKGLRRMLVMKKTLTNKPFKIITEMAKSLKKDYQAKN